MSKNWNLESVPSQHGKTAIVTGANVGLGYETALALAKKDFEVIIAARNQHKAEKAIEAIKQKYPSARVKYLHLDLSRLTSVRHFAAEFLATHQKLDLLINNAGIMMPPFSLTEDGFESQFGTNYLGHFLLTGLLLSAMKEVKNSRVVTLSSMAHKPGVIQFNDLNFTKNYNKIKAYSQSKLACLMFAYELQRKLEKAKSRTMSLAAHPGVSSTHLGRSMSPVLRYFFPKIGQPAEAGALPILMASLDDSAKGGEYYGPDGFLEMRGNPTVVGSTSLSKNKEVAEKLWEVSEKLVGFKYSF
jgi:NAD(P)-dependent dehydrogenase (short-subunit alcohol dehydrogenase family)